MDFTFSVRVLNTARTYAAKSVRLSLLIALASSTSLAAMAADVDSTPLHGGAAPHTVTKNQKPDLHQNLRQDVNKLGVSPKEIRRAEALAKVINTVPGEKVSPKDLEHPPIQGFHPIQKLVSPIHNLTVSSEKLDNEATKLEKPIGDMQSPMVHLQKDMVGVDKKVGHMQHRLRGVSGAVTGARSDLAVMRKDIEQLRTPIMALQKPVTGIAHPLEQIQIKLNVLLLFIGIFGLIVSFGTPLTAILLFKNRRLFLPAAAKAPTPAKQIH